jgi:hypothetical protein
MDRGKRFVSAIAVFILIAIVILVFIQNIYLKGILLVLDFGAVLRVLYQIATPREKEGKVVKVCNAKAVAELEVDMDGTVRQRIGRPERIPKKKRAKKGP